MKLEIFDHGTFLHKVHELLLITLQIIFKHFDKKTFGNFVKNENMSDQQLGKESHKQIFRKFKKRKVHSSFINNIWGC